MHSDFTPVVHTLDGRTVKVYVIGDVHLGAPECDVQGFKKVLAKIAADDDAYLVLVGDILNNATKDSLSNVYEETMPPSAQIELAAELLTPVKDKILGMVAGNHESRSRKAVDLQPLLGVAYMIGAQDRYRTNLCFIRVVLKRKSTKNNYTMLLVHGKTANKRKQFQYSLEGVDIVCSGHVHQGLIEKPARICMTTASNVVARLHSKHIIPIIRRLCCGGIIPASGNIVPSIC